eukprot:gene19686-26373_t
MSPSQMRTVGHLSFVFVLVLLIGTMLITNKKMKESFDNSKTRYSVTFFYQEGCGHCHEFLNPSGPLAKFAKLVTSYLGKDGDGKNCNVAIDFSKAMHNAIDIHEPKNKDIANKYNISYTPFVVLLDSDGNNISEFNGSRSCDGLAKWINTAIPCIPQSVCNGSS